MSIQNSKLAGIIKAFIILKKRPVTSKEIAEFCNTNKFGFKGGVSSGNVAKLIRSHQAQKRRILFEVKKKEGHPNTYYIPKGGK